MIPIGRFSVQFWVRWSYVGVLKSTVKSSFRLNHLSLAERQSD